MGILKNYGGAGSRHGGAGRITRTCDKTQWCPTQLIWIGHKRRKLESI